MRAVFELAKHEGSGPVKAARVASAQFIPTRFLENILAQMRQAGIVESVRGKEGGYFLRGRPEDVSVGEVIRAVRGPMPAVDNVDGAGGRESPLGLDRVLLPMWERAHNAMMDVYDGTTFKDLLQQERAVNEREAINYAI